VNRARRHVASFAFVAFVFAAPGLAAFRCDSTTALTLVGVDTTARRALFALPVAGESGDSARWLLEADLAGGAARAWEEPPGPVRFGGSTGPGPILTAERCGPQCLQVVRLDGERWRPAGESLLASDATTLHLTWDRAGAAWAVIHSLVGGRTAAAAYRLEGGDWVSKGALALRAVGNPGAVPAVDADDGVISGDGLFTATSNPRRWLEALPAVADARSGELVWLGGKSAAHLAADGMRTTADGGVTWQPLRWQPLTGGEGDLAWRAGRDYRVELAEGERRPPLAAMWTDRRVADEEKLLIAAQVDGAWRVLARTPAGILTEGGERLPYNHLFRFAGERWELVTGCVARPGGASLAIRRFADGKLSNPELVKIALP